MHISFAEMADCKSHFFNCSAAAFKFGLNITILEKYQESTIFPKQQYKLANLKGLGIHIVVRLYIKYNL